PALAGQYVACFRGTDSTRPACGTLTLSAKTVCGNSTQDGYYSVLFSALPLKEMSAATRPDNEAHFTWEQSPDGALHFTRAVFAADSLLGGGARCDESPGASNFEAWGHPAGDSIAGSWGRYDHYSGTDTLGTFVLRRMPK
ncbi:MAG TPA: hypothetical protein VFK36_13015, partial [Gemmatimonadales bacterium]|nr:hypothetical protein [Gemmatimonadales bacterium]